MKRKPPKKIAAGIPSVVKALEKSLSDMGPVRSIRVLGSLNQKEGFDCPGCAWPEHEQHRHTFEFCENGAKAVADEATTRKIGADFFRQWSIDALQSQPDVWLNAQGRLIEPLLLRNGSRHYEPIAWEEAFACIAQKLRSLESPDQAVFYTSGRTSNEAAFLYQLFVRRFGTNNLPDCSNMCHESSGEGLRDTIGVGKGTVTLDDFAHADAIFILGQNPGTNHPRMLPALQAAARRGCKIVAINPLPEAGLLAFRHPQEVSGLLGVSTPLSSLFLPVRINGDVALLKGIMKEMLAEEDRRPGEVLDSSFIDQHTHGFDAFAADLRATTWEEVTTQSGIDRPLIREAAEIAIRSQRTIVCWAMGLTQHVNAVANVQSIVNFLLLRGNIGRSGAGVCPVRGHSNVQGDRTVGIWERMPDEFLDALEGEFHFDPPRHHGLDTVNSIHAMLAGNVKVFCALGGNFLSASPDTERTAAALQKCDLTVHVATKLNRSHITPGTEALILPCLGRTERDVQACGRQFVTTENSMGVVTRSEGVLEPASPQLLSEVSIVARLAKATLDVDWSHLEADYRLIRTHIEHVLPQFEQYNQRIAESGSFALPNAARNRRWNTTTRKANFTVHPVPRLHLATDEWILMTIRSHDQFNTTIYSNDDRYRGIFGDRRIVLLNSADIKAAGFQDDQLVDLLSGHPPALRIAPAFRVVPYPIPRRCAAAYFPEANVLVALESVAERSNTPASKSVIIRIRPAQ
jgi:molybdopterin-dependent oxidoreductase alpha subunit